MQIFKFCKFSFANFRLPVVYSVQKTYDFEMKELLFSKDIEDFYENSNIASSLAIVSITKNLNFKIN